MLPRHLQARLRPSIRSPRRSSVPFSAAPIASTSTSILFDYAPPCSRRSIHLTPRRQALLPFFGLQKKRDDIESHAENFSRFLREARDAEGSSSSSVSSQKQASTSQKTVMERLASSYAALRTKLQEEAEEDALRAAGGAVPVTEHVPLDDLIDTLKLLSGTAYIHTDFLLASQIFRDMLFSTPASLPRRAHHFYLLALCNASRLGEARQHLHNMMNEEFGERNKPRTPDWNVYIRALKRNAGKIFENADRERTIAGYNAMKKVVKDKMGSPVYADNSASSSATASRDIVSWNTLLSALFETLPYDVFEDPSHTVSTEARWIRSAMEKDGISPDQVTYSTLLLGYAELGDWAEARKVEAGMTGMAGDLDLHSWNSILRYRGLLESDAQARREAVQATIAAMRQAGKQPDKITLETVFALESDTSAGDPVSLEEARNLLAFAETSTGVLLGHQVYTLALKRVSTFSDALALYHDAQRDGVPCTSALLKALVAHSLSAPASHHAALVKSAYSDLLNSKYSSSATGRRSKLGLHDLSMYSLLLQWCSQERIRELDWGIILLEDLRYQGLAFENSERTLRRAGKWQKKRSLASSDAIDASSIRVLPASEVVCSLMRIAKDHSQAFKAYSWMWAIDQENIFTYSDFADIIRTFAALDFAPSASNTFSFTSSTPADPSASVLAPASNGKGSYCPAPIFFAFFDDMRKCHLPPRSDVYQSVLHYYSYLGVRDAPSIKAVQDSVRQTHDLIKMDQYIDPDIGLMNRLMFAYSRVQNVSGAFGVWRNILVNRMPFNNVSVSIVLDMYGYSGKTKGPQGIQDLWTGLKRRGFALNRKNLEAYIEGLGRLGLQSVADEAFWKESQELALQPEAQTLQILLKATRGDGNVYHPLVKRLQAEMPELYELAMSGSDRLAQSVATGDESNGEELGVR